MENAKRRPNINAHIFLKINLVLCFLIVFFTMTGNLSIVSMILTLTFLFLLLALLPLFLKKRIEVKVLNGLAIVMIIVGISLISTLIVTNNVSFDYFKKLIMFSSTIICLFVVTNITVDKRLISFLLNINFLFVFAYLIIYLATDPIYYGGGITLNFSNPNLLGIWLMHTFLYSILGIVFYKSCIIKLLSMFSSIFILLLIFETNARSVILALILSGLIFLLIILKRNMKFGTVWIVSVILYPLLFSFLYLVMVDNKFINSQFNFLVSEGKNLDSRVLVWNEAFVVIKNNILFGDYYYISGGTGMSQLHNTHIDILASYGVLVFVLFLLYLFNLLKSVSEQSVSVFQRMGLVSFFAVIFMGAGEAALVSGSIGMFILSCSFLLVARYNDKGSPNNKIVKSN